LALQQLIKQIQICTLCHSYLPQKPRPILNIGKNAKVMIIGQAPGTQAHESGIPWNDRSGDRLREWLNIDWETFYDTNRIAIMPIGFCYPGRLEGGGDKAPRPECAPTWHSRLLNQLPNIKLTLLVGLYAQAYYLDDFQTLTNTVENWKKYLPSFIPTPHPSWRTTAWQQTHPWFEKELIPELRGKISSLL